jgi:hypothetical protein
VSFLSIQVLTTTQGRTPTARSARQSVFAEIRFYWHQSGEASAWDRVYFHLSAAAGESKILHLSILLN